MSRFLLATFAFAASLSGASSFTPTSKPTRHNNIHTSSIGNTNANGIESPTTLSLSPGDILTELSRAPGPLLYPVVFVVCFRIGAALAVIGQPRMPQHDKDQDESRRLVGSRVVRLPDRGSRVRVFYPISDEAAEILTDDNNSNCSGSGDAKYCTDGRATSDGMAGLVGFRQLGLSFLLAHLADAPSGCYTDDTVEGDASTPKEFASCETGVPLLVYSHGYGGNMDMATYFLRAIAQKGIAVAAVEHTDGTASSTVLPGETRLDFDGSLCSLPDGLDKRAGELLEAVEVLPSLLGSDSSRVYLGGHSYGAPSVLLAAQNQKKQREWKSSPRVAGTILHDPALSMGRGVGIELPPKLPTVSYTSDEYHRGGVACGDATYHVRGCRHGNFVDAPLWAPLWVMRTLSVVLPVCGPADPVTIHEELAESCRAFCCAPAETLRVAETRAVGGQSLFERVG